MFFLKDEERVMTLHPSFFDQNIQFYLFNQLIRDVEGTIAGDYFVICVLDNHAVTEGKIIAGNGRAEFLMHYRAICWKPFKGEVVHFDPSPR
jgi:DNA-directed RNA polymerase II subunit RPB7